MKSEISEADKNMIDFIKVNTQVFIIFELFKVIDINQLGKTIEMIPIESRDSVEYKNIKKFYYFLEDLDKE